MARCRRDVDGVDAGARTHDERQPAGIEHRLSDGRRADDQHLRAARAQRLDEALVLEGGIVLNVAARGFEPCDP